LRGDIRYVQEILLAHDRITSTQRYTASHWYSYRPDKHPRIQQRGCTGR
jgi:site-specific recombinase XerC